LGFSTDTLKHPTPRALEFVEDFETAAMLGSQRSVLGAITSMLPNKRLDDAVRRNREFVSYYMDKAMEVGKNVERERSYVFFDEMIKSGATREYMRDQILSIIIAGRDTTAHVLAATIYFLARDPESVKRCRQEVLDLATQTPTWEQLKDMKYMNACIKEGQSSKLWS
jgi:cytochrome P450